MSADDMHATTKTGLRHIPYAAQRARYQFGRTFETGRRPLLARSGGSRRRSDGSAVRETPTLGGKAITA
jgi:hypothetical protein